MLKRPASPADLPKSVPIFPLSGALLLPFSHRPLNVFEPRYVDMVDAALRGDRLIGLIQPEDTSEESPRGRDPLQAIGCLGRITHFEESGEGRYFIILEGVTRFRLAHELTVMTPYRQGVVDATEYAFDFTRDFGEDEVDRERFVKLMRDYAEFANIELNFEEIERTGTADLVNFCCMVGPYGPADKQVLLEAPTLEQRAETLIAMTEYEMARGTGGGAAPLN
ncbi:LON peptidase substrate-binding domain-containing protein [Devosia neptuniae]|jgi:Lon protease-like protein|uniref:LON peptidase substrate-binding domain-containing protein n=1 Tax=Devosia TaxID=46913 RepID=UPI0022AED714|nr:LON peptidase substrate-binding domain-containing protein [Devosia neptuniae]MCZ4347837.1 LON peptidase substrate-binding domain-containing protein [Devosia neptuniae]|tara:strand:+ start:4025 stop:4693 length:669 start_codon:yes stop_codon:yes gene_type:complete